MHCQFRKISRSYAFRYSSYASQFRYAAVGANVCDDLRDTSSQGGYELGKAPTLRKRHPHAQISLEKSCKDPFRSSGLAYRTDRGIPVVVNPVVAPSGSTILASP